MSNYQIKAKQYEYHYDHGFTGGDAAGWDPNLQYAWSRTAAAKACGIKIDTNKVIANLIKSFGHDDMIHEMVGIQFHEAQILSNKEFCTSQRTNELQVIAPKLEAGKFPLLFKNDHTGKK